MSEIKKITREQRKTLLKRLKSEIGPHKVDLYKAAFLGWIQFAMRIISFYIIAQNIAHLYTGKQVNLFQFMIQLVLLNLVGYVVSRISLRYQGVASQYARNNLKKKFFNAFQQNNEAFGKQSASDVLVVASQGIDSLDTYFQHYLSMSLRAYFNCATILLLVSLIYPIGGVIFIASLPLIPVSIILMQKRSKQIMQHYWTTYMDVGNLFMDDLKGLNTLYTYSADERYERTFIEKAEAFRQSTMQLLRFQLESVGYMDGVMYLGVGISGFAVATSLANGSVSLFTVIFFVLIAAEFFAPIREMGYGMHLVMMNTKMADQIYRFLDSVTFMTEKEENIGGLQTIDCVQLKNISFDYDGVNIFENVSATIQRGDIFAVAGESGLGKTTLAKLIQKRCELKSGAILFNDQNIEQMSTAKIQDIVMYVSPNNYVFNVSIYENLIMGCNLSKEEIEHWLLERSLLQFINLLPDGLDTVVGENGNHLSPGQRQQIICARALLANKQIYIFDEMTSSIDNENEQVILDYIKLTAKNAIVLFISHKMKQVMQANQVLFIGKGHQVALGTPKKLLEENVEFTQLVQTQNDLEVILYE